MKGVVTFAASAHSGANNVTFIGDFTVVVGATANSHRVVGSGQTVTITDAALVEFRDKINSIARGRHERISG